jgi:hypothetical protein
MYVTERYEPIKHKASRDGRCPVCGRYVRRSRVFSETLSPFNKNPDGTVKDVTDIRKSLIAKAWAWTPDFTHKACSSD